MRWVQGLRGKKTQAETHPNTTRSLAGLNRSKTTSIVAGIAVPAILGALAIVNPGVPVSEVDLNDGGVWVTNTNDLKVGRYNAKVRELNGGVITTGTAFDVMQDADDVYAVEPALISKIDPATLSYESAATIPSRSQVAMSNGTIAVTDPSGKVWVMNGAEITSIDEAAPTEVDLADGAVSAVSPSSLVYSFDPASGSVFTTKSEGGALVPVGEIPLKDASGIALSSNPAQAPAITLVGETPVVVANDMLYTPKATVSLAEYGNQSVLQAPGPQAGQVLVAHDSGMIAVDLASGDVTVLVTGASGRPAQPVLLGGCLYGAWASSSQNYVRSCGHTGGDYTVLSQGLATIDDVTELSTLTFRINRAVIVLNDTKAGKVWLPENMPQSEALNWRDIEAPDQHESTTEEQDDTDPETNRQAECAAGDRPPRAKDDEFGVRPGRSTTLDVLGNDSAGTCGIIAITNTQDVPNSFGTVQMVSNGRLIQVDVEPDARGTITFDYTITDGRGANPPSTATATLQVKGPQENQAPEETRKATAQIEQGATLNINALAHVRDPEGDPLILESAEIRGADKQGASAKGSVRVRKDGMLTYVADTDSPGRVDIELTISDGTDSMTSVLEVEVRPTATLPPVVDPLLRTAYVSQTVEVDVLGAVKSRSTEEVRLAAVDEVAGTTINADLEGGTFTFSAPSAGSYYVNLTLVSAPHTVTALARIDVSEWPTDLSGPVAVSDVALLPGGSEVTVAPLANDYDPNGGVMVLTGVGTEEGSRLNVGVIEHRFIRISSSVTIRQPEVIHYLVDNGYDTARGTILVQPVEPSSQQRPPEIKPINVSVRAGGVVTIPVLNSVTSADNSTISLVQELPSQLAADEGLLFVSGDVLRYHAPEKPRTTKATFQVTDSAGNIATGEVQVNVHNSTPETKGPTKPKVITARAYAGETIRIQIPLTGIDPDGDGVTLLGQGDTVPQQGYVSAVGADWIEYTASDTGRATDTFSYAVEDWTGQRALGTIRVGIVEKPLKPLPIVAADDEVTVAPGTSVEVRVTRNDMDPSGLELTVAPLGAVAGAETELKDNRIVVTVPRDAAGTILIPYSVSNTVGATAQAVLRVIVNEEALIAAPRAKDIVVAPYEVVDKTSVEVDVLAVAENPSGPLSDLELAIPDTHAATASVTGTGKVTVALDKSAQIIPFKLTNTKAPAAYTYAFISVPALGDFPPVLRPKARALEVASGQSLEIPLAEFVQVGPGKTAYIRDAQTVSSGQGDGSPLVIDDQTLRFTSRPDFVGTASLTFQVWDSSTDEGKFSVLTIPIKVFAEKDYPPTFSPTLIQVPQGGEPVPVDLREFTSTPGRDSTSGFGYKLSGAPTSGFKAHIEDSVLHISAPVSVARGTSGSVALTLTYGVAGSMPVTVPFEAVASNKTLPVVRSHDVVANAGETTSVDVLAGAVDPVGQGLRVLSATVLTATSGGSAVVSGKTINVTPAEGFSGTMKVAFTVRDALNDPSREVEGTINLTVRKEPDAPGRPRVSNPANKSVTVAWDAPTSNGAPIQGYRVTAAPGGTTTTCPTTTCVISGLQNGTAYTFTVAAFNEVGYSPESPASADITPDILPGAPAQPQVVYGDQSVAVNWQAPTNEGSRILSYTVEISPGIGSEGVSTRSVQGLNTTIGGLKNGTAYSVRVRAVNAALVEGGAGPWSPMSVPVQPAGVPEAPSVKAKLPVDTPLGRQINVAWTPNGSNGDAISGYTLTVLDGTTEVLTKKFDASVTTWAFTEAQNGVDYKFAVRAKNKAGQSAPGVSDPISSFTAPSSPTSGQSAVVTGRSHAQGGAVELSWGVPAETGGKGVRISHYEIKEGGVQVSGTKHVVDQLTPGQWTGDFHVRACNDRGSCSPWMTIPGATPVTTPQSPVVSGPETVEGTKFSFTITGRNDGGSKVTAYEYRVDGGAWVEARKMTNTVDIEDLGEAASRPVLVEARATNSQGAGKPGELTVTVVKEPMPSAPTDITFGRFSSGSDRDVLVQWKAPTVGASKITKYGYCLVDGPRNLACPTMITENYNGLTTLNASMRNTILTRLERGTFTFKVWGITETGIGEIAEHAITVPVP